MKNLLYIRHGQSESNAKKVYTGRTDPELSEVGIAQATEASKTIDQKVDLIITSSLKRAGKTAEIIADEISYDTNQIEINDLLIERSFGKLENVPYLDGHETSDYIDMSRDETAEQLDELHIRAKKALEYLNQRPEDTILVVGHGTFGRAFLRTLRKLPIDSKIKPMQNGKVTKLITEGEVNV